MGYYVGQRVIHTATGAHGAVIGTERGRVTVRFDDGGTHSGPMSHGGYKPEPKAEPDTDALATGEHTARDERAAHAARRTAIDAGRAVSLIAYDPARGVYAWDVLS